MELQAGTAGLPARSAASERFWPLLRLSFAANGFLLGVAFAYLGVFSLLDLAVPGMGSKPGGEIMLGIVCFSLPAVLFGLLSYKFIEMALHEKPKHPLAALWRNFKSIVTDPERMASGIPIFAALVIFMYVFTMVKAYVSVLAPFSWDGTFDRWDVALHFGTRPWELLQPVLGYWPVTFLINVNYNMWFVAMNVFLAYYAFIARPGAQRTRFFLSYMLIWIIGGGVLAVLFSSAGPCYFTRLGIFPDPYAPLMAYLAEANTHAPVWALTTQDMLWDLKTEGSGRCRAAARQDHDHLLVQHPLGAELLCRRDLAHVAVVRGARRIVVEVNALALAPGPWLQLHRIEVLDVERVDDVEAFLADPGEIRRVFLAGELLGHLFRYKRLVGGLLGAVSHGVTLLILRACSTPYT